HINGPFGNKDGPIAHPKQKPIFHSLHCPQLVLVPYAPSRCTAPPIFSPATKLEKSKQMSGVVRAALRSKCTSSVCALVQGSHGLPVRCFSTAAEQPPLNSTASPSFFDTDHSGVTYGKLLGIRKHVLKTDIVNFLEGCNLTLEDVKMDYNRNFFPVSTLLQFPTRDSYDNAIRVIVRKGRLYKLDRADRSQWDRVTPYDGKTVKPWENHGRAQSFINPTLESHYSNVGLKSHILQLDPNISPRSAALVLMQADCTLNHITKSSYCSGTAQTLINPTLESHSFNVGFKSHTLQFDPNIIKFITTHLEICINMELIVFT
ncbi:hypothetical protein CR513_17207, partial [Mucuna pruriens]